MIPFPKAFYDDIVRFSDGLLDPAFLAVDQVRQLLEFNADDNASDWFGDRIVEFYDIHFPEIVAEWKKRDADEITTQRSRVKPLVWKEVTIPSGADVRMQYGGTYHYAKVQSGKIADDDGEFSPSRWASKIAANTSRDAWRDLSFKFPGASAWQAADQLRVDAKALIEELGL